ncbi:MAG: carbohydrate-binding domain-containing protein, partial [Bacteroidota bacterium]
CDDIGGGCNSGWSNVGEWLEYTVQVTPGVYRLKARMASNNNTGRIRISLDGVELAVLETPNESNGWQDWHTAFIDDIAFSGGEQVLRVDLLQGGVNLNWIEVIDPNCDCNITNNNCSRSTTPAENKNTWIGPDNAKWSEQACFWSKSCLPTSCDDILIPEGSKVILDEDTKVYSLELEQGAELQIINNALLEVILN